MAENSPTELARRFVDVARQLEAAQSTEKVLETIVEMALSTVDGCEDAGVLLVDRKRNTFDSPALSSELVRASDAAQLACNEGPCIDAARHERSFLVEDMATETRWPHYAPRAVEIGVGSMMGFQLYSNSLTMGALDLYSRSSGAFSAHSRDVGWILASHAAIALAAARQTESLRAGFETRQEIGEAVGVLMERHRLTSDDAFEVLKKASMRSNVKLREVARRVTFTGQLPSTGEHGDESVSANPAG